MAVVVGVGAAALMLAAKGGDDGSAGRNRRRQQRSSSSSSSSSSTDINKNKYRHRSAPHPNPFLSSRASNFNWEAHVSTAREFIGRSGDGRFALIRPKLPTRARICFMVMKNLGAEHS